MQGYTQISCRDSGTQSEQCFYTGASVGVCAVVRGRVDCVYVLSWHLASLRERCSSAKLVYFQSVSAVLYSQANPLLVFRHMCSLLDVTAATLTDPAPSVPCPGVSRCVRLLFLTEGLLFTCD